MKSRDAADLMQALLHTGEVPQPKHLKRLFEENGCTNISAFSNGRVNGGMTIRSPEDTAWLKDATDASWLRWFLPTVIDKVKDGAQIVKIVRKAHLRFFTAVGARVHFAFQAI